MSVRGNGLAVKINEGELTSYWATVCVLLSQPVRGDRGEVVNGYYVNFGLWSVPEAVTATLDAIITDGVIDWSDTTIEQREPDNLGGVTESPSERSDASRVWYRSGRAFFTS